MTLLKSSLREQPTPPFSRWLKVVLPVLLCLLVLVVVGTILASLSPPLEKDTLNQAIAASEIDLMVGDAVHNQALERILAELDSDGYLVNGSRAIAENRWDALRGRQSVMSPDESQLPMEWRLMVCTDPQENTHSFFAVRLHNEAYSANLLKAFENEWLHYSHPLPAEVVSTAQVLLARAAKCRAEDQEAVSAQYHETDDADIAHRRWQFGGTNGTHTYLNYRLRLKRTTSRYEVNVELHDDRDTAGNSSGCWLCIDFIRLPSSK